MTKHVTEGMLTISEPVVSISSRLAHKHMCGY